MRLAVLGVGLMGRAAAWDLARQPGVESVTLVEGDRRVLEDALAFLEERGTDRDRLVPCVADLSDEASTAQVLTGHLAALCALPYRLNLGTTRAAIRAGVHLCDLGGNPEVVDRQLELDRAAAAMGVSVIPDCGLAPGLTNVLVAALLERLPECERIRIRVGGLPAHPRPPLFYKLVFSPAGLVNEYVEPCRVLREGEPFEVAPLTGSEEVTFPAPFGELEARHTSGGSSTLVRTLTGRVTELDYKTLRYPGHFTVMEGVLALGLFSSEPVEVDGVRLAPRRLVEERLRAALDDDDTDVVLLRVSAASRTGRTADFELIDRADPVTGLSAMQRTTALPAAAISLMQADGTIDRRGVLPPESAVPADSFLAALAGRGLEVVFTGGME
jgi:lysine 6-dehydrogenase